ncbi:EF_hand domain-containing protein [Hexamita inflata]|uniref:EF hand domain-containing protein n=1 Tax=Hexamita inflata TaxID=28002 RepID=A0AA86R082_9EUKA|nr:EF hand domain-containing protein [Hexamita inflata]
MTVNLTKYEQIFQKLDQDRKGSLDIQQLYHAVNKQLKIDMDMKTLEVMMALVDDNNDGVMQEDEFCHFLYICQNADFNDTKSILFYAADDDYSGSIDKFELLKIAQKLRLNILAQDVFKVIQKYSDNEDGSLSHDKFIQVMELLSSPTSTSENSAKQQGQKLEKMQTQQTTSLQTQKTKNQISQQKHLSKRNIYENIYKDFDTDNSGRLTLKQLHQAVNNELQVCMDMKILQIMMTLVDENNDGFMQKDEFCNFLYICENANVSDIRSILFYAADADYSGSIDKFELLKIVKKIGLDIKQCEVFEYIRKNADNDDDSLSYNTFIKVMDQMSNTIEPEDKDEQKLVRAETVTNSSQLMTTKTLTRQSTLPVKSSKQDQQKQSIIKQQLMKNSSISFI